MTPSPSPVYTSLQRDDTRFGNDRIDGDIVRRRRHVFDELEVECAGDTRARGDKQRQQAIIVAASIAEPPAAEIERDAGNQDELDRIARNLRSLPERGSGNAEVPGDDVAIRIRDRVELEHPRLRVDARNDHRLARGERALHQRARVPLAAKGERQQHGRCARRIPAASGSAPRWQPMPPRAPRPAAHRAARGPAGAARASLRAARRRALRSRRRRGRDRACANGNASW